MLCMQVLDMRGGYLYQHRPDLAPHDHLSDDELALWAAYYELRNERQKK